MVCVTRTILGCAVLLKYKRVNHNQKTITKLNIQMFFTISPGNTFILGLKDQRSRSQRLCRFFRQYAILSYVNHAGLSPAWVLALLQVLSSYTSINICTANIFELDSDLKCIDWDSTPSGSDCMGGLDRITADGIGEFFRDIVINSD